MISSSQFIIGVIGAGSCSAEQKSIAYEVGKLIGVHGHTLICGGLGGIMEAAAQGTSEAGGLTIGILPGNTHSEANKYIKIPLPTGLGEARNSIVVRTSHALIAISGEYGTLSEIAYAMKMKKPLIGIQTWSLGGRIPLAEGPEEAFATIITELKN